VNNTLCLDTGCVFGGRLTALRYPERQVVSVPARRVHYPPARPFPADPTLGAAAGAELAAAAGAPSAAGSTVTGRRDPDLLDITDVLGTRGEGTGVETRHHGRVSVRAENTAAALEVMSRFAVDPRWLLYLPPTMSPVATSRRDGLLEHPEQAFDAYRADGVGALVCEEKHMGSRAVVVLPRDAAAAARRFGVTADPADPAGSADPTDGADPSDRRDWTGGPVSATGAVHTRTGRPFFDPALTERLLARLRAAAERAGTWEQLDSDWLLLDVEVLPWSAKALDLLKNQYAAVGAAAGAALPVAVEALTQAAEAGRDTAALLAATRARMANAAAFTAAYRRYCWPTDGLDGVRLAPFQVLAAEGATFHDRPHAWHLDVADRLAEAAPDLVTPTRRVHVDATDPEQVAAAVAWWEELTASGGEGMVVKPARNLAAAPATGGARGRLVQPGLKVRGREYLRIIYGPDYTEPANLDRLRVRGLGHKRSLAAREYALGIEALERAARGEPLWRVHECVFAVLALESEPVDPRL
jgi:protein phosphatase